MNVLDSIRAIALQTSYPKGSVHYMLPSSLPYTYTFIEFNSTKMNSVCALVLGIILDAVGSHSKANANISLT